MPHVDVFNGDADGICALHQLRLAEPRAATLVTGPKRDIALLRRAAQTVCTSVTVLDISLDANRDALLALLGRGVGGDYIDPHFAGQIPRHAGLRTHIDTRSDVCTSMLVDEYLGAAWRVWAVVGAFGDNLGHAAQRLAATLSLSAEQCNAARELGECLNYNAYGDDEADLLVHPASLYARLHPHADPFQFIARDPLFGELRDGRARDLELAHRVEPHAVLDCGDLFILPDGAWSRRVRGALGNQLVDAHPQRAHAVLTHDAAGGYVVSVRAPRAAPHGADRLCRQFHSGGGRAAAAGINHLPRAQLATFERAFARAFGIGGGR